MRSVAFVENFQSSVQPGMYTGAGDDIELYHSKCGSWVTSDGTAWELLRDAESWAPSSSS